MVLAAQPESTNSGFYLLCFLAGALFLLWPIYRRILFGLGTAFIIFGAVLLVAHPGGAGQDLSQVGASSPAACSCTSSAASRIPKRRRTSVAPATRHEGSAPTQSGRLRDQDDIGFRCDPDCQGGTAPPGRHHERGQGQPRPCSPSSAVHSNHGGLFMRCCGPSDESGSGEPEAADRNRRRRTRVS